MAQPAIKGRVPPPSFLAQDANMTTDANQAETDGSGAETSAAPQYEHAGGVADELVQTVQSTELALSDVDDHAMVVKEQINRLDMERLRVAAQLVNTFNHAIQVQAGRNDWNEHDYAAFIVALRSIDRIGYDAKQNVKGYASNA